MDRNIAEQISQFIRIGLRDPDSFRLEEELETPLASVVVRQFESLRVLQAALFG